MEPDLAAGAPDSFSTSERQRFQDLVKLGGEVGAAVLQQNVDGARALVFARDGADLIGVAALKRPFRTYRERIGEKSGFLLDPELYPYEFGYVFVQPAARGRGVSHLLATRAMGEAEGRSVFATARVDNPGILRTLERAGFVSAGDCFAGRFPGVLVRLFIRNG